MFFAVLFVLLTRLTGIPDREDAPDFYTLLLGATLGMCLMATANHLLTIFLGVEMASVPSYALAGMLKGRRKSSEAALKYSVYGAGAAGVMLYGISLLAGVLGSCHLPTMANQLAQMVQTGPSGRQRDGAGARRVDGDGRPGIQALGRAIPFLVSRRVRRGQRRGERVFVGGLESRGPGAVDSRGGGFWFRGASERCGERNGGLSLAYASG